MFPDGASPLGLRPSAFALRPFGLRPSRPSSRSDPCSCPCSDPRDPGFCFCSFSDPGSRDSAAILAACNALEPAPAAIKNSDAWQRSGTQAGLQNLPLQRSWRPTTFWNLPMQPSSCSAPPCLRSDPGALARSGTCLGPLATLPTYICSDPGARQRF